MKFDLEYLTRNKYNNTITFLYLLHSGWIQVYEWLDQLMDWLSGYSIQHGWQNERSDAETYEKSAHVVRIIYKIKKFRHHIYNEKNFMFVHESYCHPNAVLNKKNCTLASISETHAIFSISK